MVALTKRLDRWRRDPVAFTTEVLVDPETGKPFHLYPAQIEFLRRAFTLTPEGRLRFPEMLLRRPRSREKRVLRR